MKDESFGIIPLKQEHGEWFVLLILHQHGRFWAFPKGHGDAGETPLEAAKRELFEETGLEVERILQETPLTERYRFRHKHRIIDKTVSYFPATVKGKLHLQQEEIRDAKWIPLKESDKQLTYPEAKRMCQELLKNQKLFE